MNGPVADLRGGAGSRAPSMDMNNRTLFSFNKSSLVAKICIVNDSFNNNNYYYYYYCCYYYYYYYYCC